MLKLIVNAKNVMRNPIGDERILFRRKTMRYGQAGSFSNNLGYFRVSRDKRTGRFVKRSLMQKVIASIAA